MDKKILLMTYWNPNFRKYKIIFIIGLILSQGSTYF